MGQQNYKIFINHCALFIGNRQFIEECPEKIRLYPKQELDNVLKQILGEVNAKENFIGFETDEADKLYHELAGYFKLIKAAGGIVFNTKGELLLIKRLGIWDLPKGKMEKHEDEPIAALREVQEECGLNFLKIVQALECTYHAYQLKGKWILKKTMWFLMDAYGDINVKPQLEEDITEVRWVNRNFILDPEFETYDSLKGLINKIKFPNE